MQPRNTSPGCATSRCTSTAGCRWMRLRRDDQLAEVRDGPGVDPERDAAGAGCAALDVVDNQSGLLLAVDEKPRVIAAHLDPDRGPGVGLQVHVRLIPGRCFLAQATPGPVRMRLVLCGVIAALLVIRAAVGRPQVERVVGP